MKQKFFIYFCVSRSLKTHLIYTFCNSTETYFSGSVWFREPILLPLFLSIFKSCECRDLSVLKDDIETKFQNLVFQYRE